MFADPYDIVSRFGIDPGMKVADLGSGSGHYALAAARFVGAHGRVYAIDVMKDLLIRLKNEASHQHIHSIDTVWGNFEKIGGTTLHDMSVDRVILSNAFFQIENEHKDNVAQEIVRIMRSGARFLFIEWSDSFGMMGPHPDQIVPRPVARELFEKKGLTFERDIDVGSHHYGMIFRKR